MVLDQAFGFSSEGERVGERDDEQRLNLVHINERKWGACGCSSETINYLFLFSLRGI
jgi:hypothetical protein